MSGPASAIPPYGERDLELARAAIAVAPLMRSGDALLREVAGAVATARAEAVAELCRVLVEGNGTHDCPACEANATGSGTLRDGRDCPLCEGWGKL